MQKERLEAFSDGVLAIILTIMVLEIKVPHGGGFEALKPLVPVLLSYVLSFIYIGINWNNHHMMLAGTSKVSGGILWANLHLLFWGCRWRRLPPAGWAKTTSPRPLWPCTAACC